MQLFQTLAIVASVSLGVSALPADIEASSALNARDLDGMVDDIAAPVLDRRDPLWPFGGSGGQGGQGGQDGQGGDMDHPDYRKKVHRDWKGFAVSGLSWFGNQCRRDTKMGLIRSHLPFINKAFKNCQRDKQNKLGQKATSLSSIPGLGRLGGGGSSQGQAQQAFT